jgi:hypothetical protein
MTHKTYDLDIESNRDKSISRHEWVIDKMLANRQEMTDVPIEYEQERLRRMHHFLIHSKAYKKLAVEFANDEWEKELERLSLEAENDRNRESATKKPKRVSFSDHIQIRMIPSFETICVSTEEILFLESFDKPLPVNENHQRQLRLSSFARWMNALLNKKKI